jgi:hypothetical protein
VSTELRRRRRDLTERIYSLLADVLEGHDTHETMQALRAAVDELHAITQQLRPQ